jgi:uncharacterized protein (TIGR02147 family)
VDTEKIDVFSYQDFKAFLKDYYCERRRRDRRFSIRFFARRAGLRSQNYLKVVMDGRRSLTQKNLPKFIKGLGLDPLQAEYFQTLVKLNQSTDSSERREHLERLLQLQKKKASLTLHGPQLEFFSHWRNVVIFEMACQESFVADPDDISFKLGGKTSPQEVAQSLDLMVSTGILVKNFQGRFVPVATQIGLPDDVNDEKVRQVHRCLLELGLAALQAGEQGGSEWRGLTIGLAREQIPHFKARLREFQKELNALFSTGKGSAIYQLNMQFFKLTKDDDEG